MIRPFAIDASTIGNWLFEDERTPDVEQLFRELPYTFAAGPALLPFEVQSALRSAERRKRISSDVANSLWDNLRLLDIRIQPHPGLADLPGLLEISRNLGLTVYDAAYLDVAMRMGLPSPRATSKCVQLHAPLGFPFFTMILPEPWP